MTEEMYWYWLNNINGIGRVTIRMLLHAFSSPKAIYETSEEEIAPYILREDIRAAFFKSKQNEEWIVSQYQQLHKEGITFLYPGKKNFPKKLLQIPDAPTGLYLKGHLPEQEHPCVAIIGARHCTRYGREMARYFGRELANCGVGIISGLARGIDGMSHQGALEAEGYSLGVLGCGIDQIYPEENYQLFMELTAHGGILSEYNIGIKPLAGLFPQRNRIISGIADAILVIEAKEKSGTFITVDQGLEQGKEIFAIPGRITDDFSVGCNHLLKIGAGLVTNPEDILQHLKIKTKNRQKLNDSARKKTIVQKMSLAPVEKMVYSCLQIEPKFLDDIIEEVRLAPQEVCMVLNRMMLSGMVVEPIRNYYAIKL